MKIDLDVKSSVVKESLLLADPTRGRETRLVMTSRLGELLLHTVRGVLELCGW